MVLVHSLESTDSCHCRNGCMTNANTIVESKACWWLISQRKRRGRGNCQNTPDYRDQRRSVFLASVSLSGVYINIFQICQVLPISLPRSSDEQKQQKEYSYICRLRDVFVTNRKEAIAGARWEIKERPIVTNISMERRASISRSEVNNRCFSHLRRHSLHNRRATLLLSQSSHRSFFGGQVWCFAAFHSLRIRFWKSPLSLFAWVSMTQMKCFLLLRITDRWRRCGTRRSTSIMVGLGVFFDSRERKQIPQ